MRKKPVLVVMAAGAGSRYGGLKQIDPVGPNGQLIIDYSIYDAKRAGFETVVFVIKKAIDEAFREAIGSRMEKQMRVIYAYQELDDLPEGYCVPEGRTKPWGTAHAILAARHVVDGPFAVINADDYYGPEGLRRIFEYLSASEDERAYALAGYRLRNTVTEHGTVARGVCQEDENHNLLAVTERTKIEKFGEDGRFTEDDGKTWEFLPGDTLVSMNLWGLGASFMREAQGQFGETLDKILVENPVKGEFLLPSVISRLLEEKKAWVRVLPSGDKWYGVTYQEDKPVVQAAIRKMTDEGLYPEHLWDKN